MTLVTTLEQQIKELEEKANHIIQADALGGEYSAGLKNLYLRLDVLRSHLTTARKLEEAFNEGYSKGYLDAQSEACKEIAKNYQPR
jgi:flagellar biosynthesis/type III secretory pathway protein FliH